MKLKNWTRIFLKVIKELLHNPIIHKLSFMKKLYLPFLLLAFFCLSNNLLSGQNARDTAPKAWQLIWHDEFNGKTLNKKKWNVLTRETSKHGELQYYIPDEVYLQDGNLRIRSSKRDFGSQHYTSLNR